MNQDEITVMDGGKCIYQLRGVRPFLSDKFDITKHKNYKLLEDYDKKNLFDVEEYLTNRDKVKLKSSYKINRLNIWVYGESKMCENRKSSLIIFIYLSIIMEFVSILVPTNLDMFHIRQSSVERNQV